MVFVTLKVLNCMDTSPRVNLSVYVCVHACIINYHVGKKYTL